MDTRDSNLFWPFPNRPLAWFNGLWWCYSMRKYLCWSDTSFCSGKGKPPAPYKNINRNTACSIYRGGIHYKSGNLNIDAHDKGTRIQNMLALISYDDHDILSERLNRFTNGELSRAYLGIGQGENARIRRSWALWWSIFRLIKKCFEK